MKDGETCTKRKKDLGNGTYKEVQECTPKYRDEPVLADKCEYEVTEWHVARTLTEKGAEDPPKWPAVSLGRTGTCLGCEREGARTETYTITLHDKGANEDDTCKVKPGDYARFPKGSKWRGQVRMLSGGIDCDTLVPR